ncbi:mutator type transposase [Tanacetum coccineum]
MIAWRIGFNDKDSVEMRIRSNHRDDKNGVDKGMKLIYTCVYKRLGLKTKFNDCSFIRTTEGIPYEKNSEFADGYYHPLTPNAARVFKGIMEDVRQLKAIKRGESVVELAGGMARGGKLSRAGKGVTCRLCKQVGHNKRKCPTQSSASAAHNPTAQATQTKTILTSSTSHSECKCTSHTDCTSHTSITDCTSKIITDCTSLLHASPTKMTKTTFARRIS